MHGCPDAPEKNPENQTYNKHWLSWIQKELTSRGIKAHAPLMPKPWAPNYKSFKKEFEKNKITKNTILVGHSCGCAFLVRWLGETKQEIKKLILVAPWKIPDENDEGRKKFYNYPVDKTISKRVNKIAMFTSNTEESDGKKSLKIFHQALGGKVINLKNHGHYTFDEMKTEKFPELLKEIIEST